MYLHIWYQLQSTVKDASLHPPLAQCMYVGYHLLCCCSSKSLLPTNQNSNNIANVRECFLCHVFWTPHAARMVRAHGVYKPEIEIHQFLPYQTGKEHEIMILHVIRSSPWLITTFSRKFQITFGFLSVFLIFFLAWLFGLLELYPSFEVFTLFRSSAFPCLRRNTIPFSSLLVILSCLNDYNRLCRLPYLFDQFSFSFLFFLFRLTFTLCFPLPHGWTSISWSSSSPMYDFQFVLRFFPQLSLLPWGSPFLRESANNQDSCSLTLLS